MKQRTLLFQPSLLFLRINTRFLFLEKQKALHYNDEGLFFKITNSDMSLLPRC